MDAGDNFDAGAIADRAHAAMNRFVEAIRSNPYRGAAASLYVQGKVLDMVAEVLAGPVAPTAAADGSSAGDYQCGHAARDIILADLAHPPRIEDVARQVGLSQRRLIPADARNDSEWIPKRDRA